ncbi:hypothetical protein GCM10010515_30620 [Streptomyces fructofermentans]|uniref:Uncharacterized protein n=1 Tax=Streptomyces fructofermentans TaxID=152141 RepID=A0A918KFA6_9ACTN|nr:hypothetical protein GCM10010515_30620 [Streptomyces fructofermentans]
MERGRSASGDATGVPGRSPGSSASEQTGGCGEVPAEAAFRIGHAGVRRDGTREAAGGGVRLTAADGSRGDWPPPSGAGCSDRNGGALLIPAYGAAGYELRAAESTTGRRSLAVDSGGGPVLRRPAPRPAGGRPVTPGCGRCRRIMLCGARVAAVKVGDVAKLNQIIAVEKGIKSKSHQDLTAAHHGLQKPALLAGISRTYQPKDEEGEQLPPESTRVQVQAEDVLRETAATLTRLFDVTATKDWANCTARADVKVDGQVLVADVPVSYLLFLEKQLTDLNTFVRKLPVLDASESWVQDPSTDAWKTEPVRTLRTKKVPRNHVKAEATDKHPAQVEVYYEDIPVGYWTTVKFSGALPARRVNELLGRVEKVQQAVKFAREEANGADVTDKRVGDAVFGYLFG